MKFPTIHGFIDRRILINFIVDPKLIEKIIPAPFKPKIYNGNAIAGICLIRLKHIKPKGFPDFIGVSSENGLLKEGVFIPRRDTSLRLNTIIGGRIFPGKHHYAKFNVVEKDNNYHIDFISSDHTTISIDAKETKTFNRNSVFKTIENVSAFFENGSVGYSPNEKKFEGLKLKTFNWKVRPLEVSEVRSTFFENEKLFPKGSIKFDNALLMTEIEHEWHTLPDK